MRAAGDCLVKETPAEALFEAWVMLERAAERGGPLWYRIGYACPVDSGDALVVDLWALPQGGDVELKLPKGMRREELARRADNFHKHPTMLAYTTDEVRIGGAFRHRDGQGLRVRLFAFPLDGAILLKPARTPEELAAAQDSAKE